METTATYCSALVVLLNNFFASTLSIKICAVSKRDSN